MRAVALCVVAVMGAGQALRAEAAWWDGAAGARGLGPPAARGAGEDALADEPPVARTRPVAPTPAVESTPAVAHTQPDSEAAGSLEVSAQLWGVIARYRFGATADRVRVTLAQASGRSDMLSLVVRCVPGAAGLARLELGGVVLAAARGAITAVHENDPTTYALLAASNPDANPAEILRELLPPLPIPQLSLAFDPGDVDWCPLVHGVRWESAARIEHGGERGVRLTGRSEAGPAALELVAGRVRRFEAVIDGDSGTSLIVESEPVAPGDPALWAIDTSGRRRVERLGDLRALGSQLGPGAAWPGLRITSSARGETSDWPARAAPSDAAASLELRAAWLVRAGGGPESVRPLAEKAIGAVIDLRREIVRGGLAGRFDKRLAVREFVGIALIEQEGRTFELLGAQRASWEAALDAVWPEGQARPEMVWSPAEARPLDRVSPGAASALVLIDGRGVVLAAIPVTASTAPAELSAALTGQLPELP